jgi:hypothetical protein
VYIIFSTDLLKPSITAKSSHVICQENDVVDVSITVTGSPAPAVIWMKDGKVIARCEPFFGSILCKDVLPEYNVSYMGEVHVLRINKAVHKLNHGDYECIARNLAGQTRVSISVSVYGKWTNERANGWTDGQTDVRMNE